MPANPLTGHSLTACGPAYRPDRCACAVAHLFNSSSDYPFMQLPYFLSWHWPLLLSLVKPLTVADAPAG